MAGTKRRQRRRQWGALMLLSLGTCWFLVACVDARALDRPLPPQRPPLNDGGQQRPPPPPRRPDVPQNEQQQTETAPTSRGPPPRPPPPRQPPRADDRIQQQSGSSEASRVPEAGEKPIKKPDPPETGAIRPPPQRPQAPLHRPPPQRQSLMRGQQQQRLHQPPPQYQYQYQQQQRPHQLQQYQFVRPLPPRPQQQRGGPPPGGRLKSLWKQVERGLDGLADLEDAVTDRAKNMLSVPGFRSGRPSFKALPPPPTRPQTKPQPKKEEPKTTSADARRAFGDQKTAATNGRRTFGDQKQAAATGGGRRTFGYPVTVEKGEHGGSSDDEAEKTRPRVETYRIMTGERREPGKKLIGANGGASSPPSMDSKEQKRMNGGERELVAAGPYSRLPPRQTVSAQKPVDTPKRPYTAAGGSPYAGRGQAQQQPKRQPPMRRSNPISDLNAMPRPTGAAPKPARPFVDDDEPSSLFSKFVGILPPLPRLPSLSRLVGRGSSSYKLYADASLDAWKTDDEESQKKKGGLGRLFRRDKGVIPSKITTTSSRTGKLSSSTPPITELLARSKHSNATCLLSDHDVRQSKSIGKSRAAMDAVCLGFVILGMRELVPYLAQVPVPHSLSDLMDAALPELRRALGSAMDGWAYFAFVAAYLTLQTNKLLYDSTIQSIASSVGIMVERATDYSELYLRLVAAIPVDRHTPDRMRWAASSQFLGVVSAARLRNFVFVVLSVIVVLTVSMVRPVVLGVLVAMTDMVTLPAWRHWPLQWAEIGTSMKGIVVPLGTKVRDLLAGELIKIIDEPLKLAFTYSVLLSVVAMVILPFIEQHRAVPSYVEGDDDDEEEEAAFAFGSAEAISNMGSSSASRLGVLSENGALENILERWRSMLPEVDHNHGRPHVQSRLRLIGYGALSALIGLLPLALHHILGLSSDVSSGVIHAGSLLDSSAFLTFTLFLTWNAMGRLINTSDALPPAVAFLNILSGTVDEFTRSQQSTQMNLQLASAVSPTKGLGVTDLWAAHTAKRAWAVRGAHLACRNGEVVVILGDDGAGKSRLLTAISEAIVAPPRRALTTTRVRGSVTFGGVDVTKWDRRQLKRRLGLVLNDVRTVADTAELLSGLTLEEILEPLSGHDTPGEPHVMSTHEKSAMNLALKITGLSATLLPRLPSKLSTVVTANEDELMPSPLRPRCNALSPAEWSKLLLARVLTQTILDNDNPVSSDHSVEKSLIGSLLLLDDVMVQMTEVEEASLINTLRRTGAATLFTSHKWATGRFADRIVVVKDGAIIENGTHNELLARGPQQSIYAAKWHAMTSL